MRTPPHASRTGPSCFETAASPPPQHEVLSMRKDSALDGSSGAKRITIARAGRPAKPGLWLFPVFVLFRPVIEGPNRATDATPPARISRLRPAAYGQRRGAGLWPAACFFAVIYREIQGRGAALARCRCRSASLPLRGVGGARRGGFECAVCRFLRRVT